MTCTYKNDHACEKTQATQENPNGVKMTIINSTSAILSQVITCCGAVLYTVGYLATSLASIH